MSIIRFKEEKNEGGVYVSYIYTVLHHITVLLAGETSHYWYVFSYSNW